MADKPGMLLTDIEGFPGDAADRLNQLWITTAEELIAAAQGDGVNGLAEYLEASAEEAGVLVTLAEAATPDFDPGRGVFDYGTGAMDEMEGLDPDDEPPRATRSVLPPSVNLIDRMPPVRNQQKRGTCVAHACVGLREYLEGPDSTSANLSEQFLYWACKDRDKWPGEGTWINIAMDILQETGVCVERIWPYNPQKVQGNESQGPPPEEAASEAGEYRIAGRQQLQPRWVDSIKEVLADENPVAFSVPVYRYWVTAPVRDHGNIRMPISSDDSIGGHAMIMVGYQMDDAVPGGGYFIVRNSWGAGWAADSDLAPGYARLPFDYITANGRAAYAATGVAPKPEPVPEPTPQPTPEPVQPQPEEPKPPEPQPDPKPQPNSILNWIRKLLGGNSS